MILSNVLATIALTNALAFLGLIEGGTLLDSNAKEFFEQVKDRKKGTFVLFNSMSPTIKCLACRPFEDAVRKMAKGHKKAKFIKLELEKSKEAFVKRKIETVPWLEYYPPCKDSNCPEAVIFQSKINGYGEEAVKDFIHDQLGDLEGSKWVPLKVLIGLGLVGAVGAKYQNFGLALIRSASFRGTVSSVDFWTYHRW